VVAVSFNEMGLVGWGGEGWEVLDVHQTFKFVEDTLPKKVLRLLTRTP
jgi:hypothetical protein